MNPTAPNPQPAPQPANPAKSASLIRWGWILVLMIPVAIVGFALVSFIVNATNSEGGIFQRIVNTLVFLIGAVGVFGFPAGIVMLIVGYSRRAKVSGPHPQ